MNRKRHQLTEQESVHDANMNGHSRQSLFGDQKQPKLRIDNVRISNDIRSLEIQLDPQNYHFQIIQSNHQRTVMRIIYFTPISKWDLQIEDDEDDYQQRNIKTKSFTRRRKRTSSHKSNLFFQQKQCENIDQTEFQQTQIRFSQKNSKTKYVQKKEKLCEKIVFTCILDYDVYPFMPPYLVVSQNYIKSIKHWKIDDYRNIVVDILNGVEWFPIYTLYDIFVKIPNFLENLQHQSYIFKGTYYYEKPFIITDIQQFGPSLKLFEGEVYNVKDTFFGKYQQRVIGISFKSLIIFKKDNQNNLKIIGLYVLNQIQMLHIEQNQQRIKFILKLVNNKFLQFKFVFRQSNKTQIEQNYAINRQKYQQDQQLFLTWIKMYINNSFLQKLNKIENSQKLCERSINEQKKSINKINNKSSQGNPNNQSLNNFSQKYQLFLKEKQQYLSKILENLDIILSSPIYESCRQNQLSDFEQLKRWKLKGKQINLQQLENKKAIQSVSLNSPCRLNTQYEYLKDYYKQIQRQRRQLFEQYGKINQDNITIIIKGEPQQRKMIKQPKNN